MRASLSVRAAAYFAVLLKALSERARVEVELNGRTYLQGLVVPLRRWSLRVGRMAPAPPLDLWLANFSDTKAKRGHWSWLSRQAALYRIRAKREA